MDLIEIRHLAASECGSWREAKLALNTLLDLLDRGVRTKATSRPVDALTVSRANSIRRRADEIMKLVENNRLIDEKLKQVFRDRATEMREQSDDLTRCRFLLEKLE